MHVLMFTATGFSLPFLLAGKLTRHFPGHGGSILTYALLQSGKPRRTSRCNGLISGLSNPGHALAETELCSIEGGFLRTIVLHTNDQDQFHLLCPVNPPSFTIDVDDYVA